MPLLRLIALLGLLPTTLAFPPIASASCSLRQDPTRSMATAPTVFVGTVTATTDGGATATVDVEEIWKGPNVSDPTTVRAVSEESATFRVGQRYLFLPSGVDTDGNLIDTACSPTSVYQPAFDALRPANAHPPQGPPTSGVPGSPPIAAIFLGILVLGSLGAFVLYRSSNRKS